MGRLTTHVLDAAHGCPGSSIKVELYRVEGQQLELVNTALTNSDGRVDAPLLQGEDPEPSFRRRQREVDYRKPLRGTGTVVDCALHGRDGMGEHLAVQRRRQGCQVVDHWLVGGSGRQERRRQK